MGQKRDLRLDGYGISKARYRELYYFCLQYREFLSEKQACYTLDGRIMPEQTRIRKTGRSDPTANKAERAYILGKNIELIEQTVIEASGNLYPWLLKALTEGLGYNDIMPPCGKNEFYTTRRRFYFLLSLKK